MTIKEENEVLKKRLGHLMVSEVVRKYDEKILFTGKYKLDINELDKVYNSQNCLTKDDLIQFVDDYVIAQGKNIDKIISELLDVTLKLKNTKIVAEDLLTRIDICRMALEGINYKLNDTKILCKPCNK